MTMIKPIKKEDRARCLRCNSRAIYVRIRTREIVCRDCGAINKMKEKS